MGSQNSAFASAHALLCLRKRKRPRLVCLLSLTATVPYLEKSHLTLSLVRVPFSWEAKSLQLQSHTHPLRQKGGITSYCEVRPSVAGYHRHSLGVAVEYLGRRQEAEVVTPAAYCEVRLSVAGYHRHSLGVAVEFLGRRQEAEIVTPARWRDVCQAAAGHRHGPVTAAEYLGRRPEEEMVTEMVTPAW
jgi:hypothetical protein